MGVNGLHSLSSAIIINSDTVIVFKIALEETNNQSFLADSEGIAMKFALLTKLPSVFASQDFSDPKEVFSLLNCLRLPARLSSREAGVLLRFNEEDIGRLVTAGMLKPLGVPAPNGIKYFATVDILRLAEDSKWLSKATLLIAKYWQQKNQKAGKVK